jgi:hypothetical protein
MATHTIEQTVRHGNTALVKSKEYTGTVVTLVDGESIADAQTDKLIAFTLDVSAVKSFYLVSDQNVTLEFNNSTTGVPTIALVANVPYVWTTDSYDSFLLTSDVTPGVYVTNASGSAAVINMVALLDGTP